MSATDDHIIEQYLKGELSVAEAQAFEQRLETEPALKEQLRLERQVQAALDENDWAPAENQDHKEVKAYAEAFGSAETRSIKGSIAQASKAYHSKAIKPKAKTRRLWYYSAAAVVAFVITFTLLKPQPIDTAALHTEYLAKTELPDLTTRSADDEAAELLRAQGFLNNGEYEQAAAAFGKLLEEMPERGGVYINLSLAQTALGQYDKAIQSLDQLINSNLLDAQKGHWYKALVYLKADKASKAKKELKTIVDEGYYNRQLATELLGDL